MIISPELIRILGTSEYEEAIYSAIPIITGGYFAFVYYIPVEVEYYHSKTKFVALGTIFTAILNIILNFIFINRYGYIAAAYTTMVSYIIYFSLHYILAIKIHGKCLFDTKVVIICSFSIILMNFIILKLIPYTYFRLIIFFIIVIISIYIEEDKIGIIKGRLKND